MSLAEAAYVEDADYKEWFEQNTQDQLKCPDPQLITFPHRKKSTQPRPVSGMQFTFDAKNNAKAIRTYFGKFLDDKVSASKSNCNINFFWAIGEDTRGGYRYRQLTLTNSIHVGRQLEPDKFQKIKCAIGYQPKSSKTVVMLKMSSKDSKEARKIIGRDKIWVYIFAANKDGVPLINLMILTRQREQTDNQLDQLDALKESLRKELMQVLKGLEGDSQKEARRTFEDLFRADDVEKLRGVNLPVGLESIAHLVDAFRFISTSVIERDHVLERDEDRPHRPISVDTLVMPSMDWFTKYSELIHDNKKTEKILQQTETDEMKISESLNALVDATKKENHDYKEKIDNAVEAIKNKYSNVVSPATLEFLLLRKLNDPKENHRQMLASILQRLGEIRKNIKDVQSQISQENEVLTKLHLQLQQFHVGHMTKIEEWRNWQEEIRSLMRKETPFTGSVQDKLQHADLFIKKLGEELIIINDKEKIVKEQIYKFQARVNRLNIMLSRVENCARSK